MSIHDPYIERGMALLDEKAPGWEWQVDLRVLDLSSCTACVVGQLFAMPEDADWIAPDRGLRRGYAFLLGDDDDPRSCGFALNWDTGYRATYGGLTTAWKRAIRRRRAGLRP